jgi:translation initiation factor IF-1
MGKNEDKIEMMGVVLEPLPGGVFLVELETGQEDAENEENTEKDKEVERPQIKAHLSGKMRVRYIKVLPGDRVKVELSVYDMTKGRIIYRFSGKK